MTHTSYGVDPSYVPANGTGRKVVRWLLVVIGLVAALNVGAALLSQWLDPQTDGPFGSSYVTTDQGVGAWRDVLIELGRPVSRLRAPFEDHDIAVDGTVIVIDPDVDVMDLAYAQALLGHVERGGRLVLVGVRNVGRLFDLEIDLTDTNASQVAVDGSGPLTRGVELVSTAPGPRFIVEDTREIVGDSGGTVIGLWEREEGDLVVVSDPRLFTNERIGLDDNGVLAVRLSGGGPVAFDEYVHGFRLDEGLVGLGAVLRRVGVVGLVATLMAMWAVGKRLGPVEQTERALPPPRGAYLDSMAINVARARDTTAYGRLRRRALRHLDRRGARYVGLDRSGQRQRAGAQLGLSSHEIAALTSETTSVIDVQEIAAIAAKIERTMERTEPWTT